MAALFEVEDHPPHGVVVDLVWSRGGSPALPSHRRPFLTEPQGALKIT